MTILNTEVIKEPNDFLVAGFLICAIICTVMLFVSCISASECLFAVSATGIILFMLLALITLFITNGYKEYNKYEVILNDKYPVKDLYEKYDVIEQRGEIWVIEDKEKIINGK